MMNEPVPVPEDPLPIRDVQEDLLDFFDAEAKLGQKKSCLDTV
jgi:hypothetical protein